MNLKIFNYLSMYVGWGTTYLAIKIGIESVEPSIFLASRFLIATLLFLPLVVKYYLSHQVMILEVWRNIAQGVGLLVLGLYPIALAEKAIPSNVVALIIGCAPIGFALFDKVLNNKNFSKSLIVSIFFGVSGVIVLNYRSIQLQTFFLKDLALVFLGIICWCFFSIYFKKQKALLPLPVCTFFQFLGASIIFLIISLGFEQLPLSSFFTMSERSWIALFYIVIFPTLITFMSYLWLLKNEPSHRVSTYAYINPVVAILSGWYVLGEPITLEILIALILILLSTFIIFNENKFMDLKT